MKLNSVKAIITVVTLLSSSFASAGLFTDTNNNSFIDTTTGLEWIDFGVNNGQSYNYVASELGSGGEYDGWNLATKDQVYTMWANAFLGLNATTELQNAFGIGQLYVADGAREAGSVLSPLIDIMGENKIGSTGSKNEYSDSLGWFQGTNGLSYVRTIARTDNHPYIGSYTDYNDYTKLYDNGNYSPYYSDYKSSNMSTLLVKTQAVPSPSTFLILGLGLLGLVLRRKI